MGRFFGQEIKTELSKVSSSLSQLASGSYLKIGGQGYENSVLTLDINSSGFGGIDISTKEPLTFYNVFAVHNGSIVGLVASKEDAPIGFNGYSIVGRLRTDASGDLIGASNKDVGSVGDIKDSRLTEEQFVLENGIGWLLYDGSDITGRRLATLISSNVLEDARGIARRGKNNGRSDGNENPDGDLALGTYTADKLGSHDHNSSLNTPTNQPSAAIGNGVRATTPGLGSFNTGLTGDNETSPKNLTVNVFIKVE